MREITTDNITKAVAKLCADACYYLTDDVMDCLKNSIQKETAPLGKEILSTIVDNAVLAKETSVPICQDTGVAVVFIKIGQDVHITGGSLYDAVNAGVAKGYINGYLRKSVVDDPIFSRVNTKDNTPAVIHTEIVPGDKIDITIAPKGAGSENMGAMKMCKPSDGVQGVIDFVVDTVKTAGANPCPPIVVGVGVGGTMEKAVLLAKESLIREIGKPNADERYAELEQQILEKINKIGIGPQGLGGRVTALAVHIDYYPTHIAALPVAVNLNCHAARHAHVQLQGDTDMIKKVRTPLTKQAVQDLQAGDVVRISGKIYTARDAAHKRMVEDLAAGKNLPIDMQGQVIYYVGPAPAMPGQVIGSAGPTTSGRMDKYAPTMMQQGMAGMIGKGLRGKEVVEAMQKYGCVYFAAVGGAGAVIAKTIKAYKVLAYDDLGAEAFAEMEVEDFPAIVVIDSSGKDFYQEGIEKYRID